jgi:hypothetical protein
VKVTYLNWRNVFFFLLFFCTSFYNMRLLLTAIALTVCSALGPGPNGLARTPPMGWMSWEIFRCQTGKCIVQYDCKQRDRLQSAIEHVPSVIMDAIVRALLLAW